MPRIRRRLAGQGGFTLVEMLIVMLILGVVLGGLSDLFASASRSELDLNRRFQAQQNARLALDSMRRDMHNACGVVSAQDNVPVTSVRLIFGSTPCTSSATDVTWCTSLLSANRYVLRRVVGAGACTTTGLVKADYFWLSGASPAYTGKLFTYHVPAGALSRATMGVDLPVDLTSTSTFGLYRLQDDIALRNFPRA